MGGSWVAFLIVKGLSDVARSYSSVWLVASWMSTCLFTQLIVGFTQFNQGSPRIMLSFPHLIAWNSSLWIIPPIFMKRVTKYLIFPASFGDPSMLLTSRGFLSFLRGILFLHAKS